MFRVAMLLTATLIMSVFHADAADFSFHVSAAPGWNQMFQKTNGWLGADVAYSIPLGTDKTLWIFGDTFVGRIRDGKRTAAKMIHSSIAIQRLGEEPQFYYPVDKKREPQSFIKSLGPKTYFWLSDGARTERGLYLFMQQVQWLNDTTWGFQCVRTWLVSVKNPDASPAFWKISRQELPFSRFPNGLDVLLGFETLKSGNYAYIYGYSSRTNSSGARNLVLARAPESDLGNPMTWEFYSDRTWTKDFNKMTTLFSGAGAEGSVSWQPFLQKYIFIYSDGIWGTILMRTADAPEGHWSAPIKIYQCPDMKFSPHVFCYAAKGHPELSATNELLISYAANSESLSDVMNDTRLYRPRFIRVTFEKP